MALPKYDGNTNYVRQLDDHVKGGADVVKYAMDKFGEEFKDWFNDTYLPALLSTEHNNSGADNIGTTPILEGADTVQKALSALLTQIQATAIGQLPDGAITDVKLSNEEGQIKDRVTEIQGEVESHKNDDTQHGIGDKTTLETTEKTTIVGAINELVAGKQNTLNADQIRKITLSTENPSGGSDGDIWIKYA